MALYPAHIPVVVLNWNGLEDTRLCVQSLLVQKDVAVDVVLVDNASEPAERDALKAFAASHAPVRLIQHKENLGFGKAHNRVFEQLRAEGHRWVACLNNDAVADPGWLRAMLDRATAEGCAMVASKMLVAADDRFLDNAGHFMLNTGEIIPKGSGDPATHYTEAGPTLGPCAGACLYDLQMLADIGDFDEHFFVGYEDAELGLRAWLAGYECHFEPAAQVRHKISASLNKIRSVEYLATIQANIFYTWFKLMPGAVLRRNLPAFCFKYTAVLVIDVVLLRFRFLKVMWKGLMTAWGQRELIRQKRAAFYSKHSIKRSTREISSRLTFFLWFDVQRFWKFIVLRRKSNLEA